MERSQAAHQEGSLSAKSPRARSLSPMAKLQSSLSAIPTQLDVATQTRYVCGQPAMQDPSASRHAVTGMRTGSFSTRYNHADRADTARPTRNRVACFLKTTELLLLRLGREVKTLQYAFE
ncbi:hypothetical protein E2562_034834 [Oryza meyeriana var. granulata]|uniref:Uncharacterized protein n=1 Tax=Oryza meyeriana var. granulata TaxID=110450 RepID=A0A6G1E7F9_9ORYZ|nr:hypothetical protein E2562_034834 [Oryza meyeriana var. granulata]